MLSEIIEEVSKRTEKARGLFAVFNDKRYSPLEFSQGNYSKIAQASGKKIAFVDGGNCEIVQAPGLQLQMIRNAAVVLKDNKTLLSKKREFYLFASVEEGKIKAKIFSGSEEETLTIESKELGKFCDTIRRASEIKFATEILEETDIVVLDGTLQAMNEMEKTHLDELYEKALEKGVSVAALAKTSKLLTEKGDSFAAMLNKEGSWQYYPVAEIESDFHKAELLFVKLNDSSKHVFRTEVHDKEKLGEIVGELKSNSRDLTFPGYPYGLILADKLARISESETDYLKAKMFAAAGSKWNTLRKNIAAVDAHKILDTM